MAFSIEKLGTEKVDPRALAPELGEGWFGEFINQPTASQVRELCSSGPFGASLRKFGFDAHMVVVDGLSKQGRLIIRDPAHGYKYEMSVHDFAELCQSVVSRVQLNRRAK